MSPEERAEAFRQWTKGDVVGRSSWDVLLPALASAIRAAENEALERAAQQADLARDAAKPEYGDHYRVWRECGRAVGHQIRSLKSKPPEAP